MYTFLSGDVLKIWTNPRINFIPWLRESESENNTPVPRPLQHIISSPGTTTGSAEKTKIKGVTRAIS